MQSMGPDTATETAATGDTAPKAASRTRCRIRRAETEKPITLEFLKSLMLQGVLTRFQTQWLLEGKFEDFTIDDYRIIDILGTGGMGWLYVGVNEKTGEKAAVKVISRHMENDYLTRFKLEARAGLLLNHPNIVRTLKLGETDEILYVVMELVEGISLQELIVRQGPLPWPQACSLVAQAAVGLQHAHEKGMVHRDIKPGNLLVKKNGTVKVLDFGLALMEKDEDEFTLAMISGQGCVGTADYISPEQTHRQLCRRPAGRHLQPGVHAVLRADGECAVSRGIGRQEAPCPPHEGRPPGAGVQAGNSRRRSRKS